MALSGPLVITGERQTIQVDAVGDYASIASLFGAAAGVGAAAGDMSLGELIAALAAGQGVASGALSAESLLAGIAAGLGVPVGGLTAEALLSALAAGVGAAEAEIDIAAMLFGAGEKGVVYDFTDPTKLITTSAGSTEVAADGDPIGKVLDLSPNGADAIQATANKRPLYNNFDGFKGADFGGSPGRAMQSPVIDFSGTDKITVVVGLVRISDRATGTLLELGPTAISNSGTFGIGAPHVTNGLTWGFNLNGASLGSFRTDTVFQSPQGRALSVLYDLAGAAQTDRIKPRINGVVPTLVDNNAGAGGGAFASTFPLNVGGRNQTTFFPIVRISRLIVIGRILTADEMVLAEAWATQHVPALSPLAAVFVGDSTTIAREETFHTSHYMAGIAPNTIAEGGDTIAGQRSKWNVIGSYTKFGAVFVRVGLNDLDPAEAASVALARLQTLINDIRADIPAASKIILSQLTPCRARLIIANGAVNGEIAYQKWLAINDAIAGNGANAITGADAIVTAHVALLNDGSGNLNPIYDVDGGGIHMNNVGREIIATAERDAAVSLGLL